MRPDSTSNEGTERRLRASASDFVRADRTGDVAASDAALRGLFQALPAPLPRAAFAERVLATVGSVPPVAVPKMRRVRDLRPAQRWLVAAAALCTALASAYLLPLAVLILGQVEWGARIAGLAAAFGEVVAWLYGLAPVGRAAFSFVGAVALALYRAAFFVLTSPEALLLLLAAVSVLAVCLRLLTELIHSPRDPAHASI